jgi:hypothetical protein
MNMNDELFEAMRKLADFFNWDLSTREDPDDAEAELADALVTQALDAWPEPMWDFRVPKRPGRWS